MEGRQQNRRNSPHADNIAERQAARGGGLEAEVPSAGRTGKDRCFRRVFDPSPTGRSIRGAFTHRDVLCCILNMLPAVT